MAENFNRQAEIQATAKFKKIEDRVGTFNQKWVKKWKDKINQILSKSNLTNGTKNYGDALLKRLSQREAQLNEWTKAAPQVRHNLVMRPWAIVTPLSKAWDIHKSPYWKTIDAIISKLKNPKLSPATLQAYKTTLGNIAKKTWVDSKIITKANTALTILKQHKVNLSEKNRAHKAINILEKWEVRYKMETAHDVTQANAFLLEADKNPHTIFKQSWNTIDIASLINGVVYAPFEKQPIPTNAIQSNMAQHAEKLYNLTVTSWKPNLYHLHTLFTYYNSVSNQEKASKVAKIYIKHWGKTDLDKISESAWVSISAAENYAELRKNHELHSFRENFRLSSERFIAVKEIIDISDKISISLNDKIWYLNFLVYSYVHTNDKWLRNLHTEELKLYADMLASEWLGVNINNNLLYSDKLRYAIKQKDPQGFLTDTLIKFYAESWNLAIAKFFAQVYKREPSWAHAWNPEYDKNLAYARWVLAQ